MIQFFRRVFEALGFELKPPVDSRPTADFGGDFDPTRIANLLAWRKAHGLGHARSPCQCRRLETNRPWVDEKCERAWTAHRNENDPRIAKARATREANEARRRAESDARHAKWVAEEPARRAAWQAEHDARAALIASCKPVPEEHFVRASFDWREACGLAPKPDRGPWEWWECSTCKGVADVREESCSCHLCSDWNGCSDPQSTLVNAVCTTCRVAWKSES
jgi:hypothetical protein